MPSPPITAIRCVMARHDTQDGGGGGNDRTARRDPGDSLRGHGADAPALPHRVRSVAGRARRPHHQGSDRDRAGHRAGTRDWGTCPRTATTTRPRTSRGTWRPASARSRRSWRTSQIVDDAVEGVVSAGSIVTIRYDGDDDDMAETYLVGHIEEKGDHDVISPDLSPRRRADRQARRRRGRVRRSRRRAQGRRGEGRSRLTAPSTMADDAPSGETGTAPPLPPGRHVELPGRGTTFIREVPGPPGAPTLVLLHGWTATADLNWFTSFEALGRRFRVIALDHRGHGRGIASSAPFRLRDCADDVVALADELGIEQIIPVGYSMGGPDRPAGLAPAPRAGRRAGAVRHGQGLLQHQGRAADVRQHGRAGPGVAPHARAACGTGCPASTWSAAPASTTPGPWSRSAATTGRRSWRPGGPSGGSPPAPGWATSMSRSR